MKQVRIAELKAKLSEYLRAVRSGETVLVMDRDRPVARLVPVDAPHQLSATKPAPGAPRPNQVPLPDPLNLGYDIVDLLLEERQNDR